MYPRNFVDDPHETTVTVTEIIYMYVDFLSFFSKNFTKKNSLVSIKLI